MNMEDVIVEAEHAMSAKTVFGDLIDKNGVSVLPVAKVMGGGGGGEGEQEDHAEGKGAGFGIRAKATGVYVIDGHNVDWMPAFDWNRIILGGQAVAVAALLTIRSIVKIHARTTRKQIGKGAAA